MHCITIRDQVCNVMAGLTKTFVSPEIVLLQKSKPCLRQRSDGKRDRQAPRPQLIECSKSGVGGKGARGCASIIGCASFLDRFNLANGCADLSSAVIGSHPGIAHPGGA